MCGSSTQVSVLSLLEKEDTKLEVEDKPKIEQKFIWSQNQSLKLSKRELPYNLKVKNFDVLATLKENHIGKREKKAFFLVL